VTADRIEPWREGAEDDEALAQAMKTAGEALADWMGWHVDRNDYRMARTVILAARAILEAPLRAEIEAQRVRADKAEALAGALTASLRAANATTRAAQGRAERAEMLFRKIGEAK
jgi:hypothetical protein